MLDLRQSSAATLTVGPCLDSAGVEYTSLVIGDLSIRKHDDSVAALAAAATLTHSANGVYTLVLTTGNTDTLGRLQIHCNKATYQIPPLNAQVLHATVYDVRYGSTAPSTLTQTQVTGGAYAINSASFAFNAALDFTTTQKAATLARVTLTDTVTTYTGNTPQTGDSYAIVNSGTYGNSALKTLVDDLPTNAELATALGTADDAVLSAIAGLNNITADSVWAVGTRTLTAGTNIDGSTFSAIPWNSSWDAEVQSEVDDALAAYGASTVTTAQVNAEVLDVLNVDTFAEPGQGAPAATASLAAKVSYLYKAWRNKKTQTATTFSLYADDGTTVDQKATTSDDGTTGTVAEIASGP